MSVKWCAVTTKRALFGAALCLTISLVWKPACVTIFANSTFPTLGVFYMMSKPPSLAYFMNIFTGFWNSWRSPRGSDGPSNFRILNAGLAFRTVASRRSGSGSRA
eukprot:1527925-Pyramimonas_sp.AAC.1